LTFKHYLSVVLFAIAAVIGLRQVQIAEQLNWNDFGTFHRAACGGPLYTDDPLTPRVESFVFRNLNPPHFHVLLWPLCGLNTGVAYGVWIAISAICLTGALLVGPPPSGDWRWLGVSGMAASVATTTLVLTGQVTAVINLPLTLAWRSDRDHRPWTAGVWLGTVVAIKPFLATIALWWIYRRAWRSLAGMTAAIGVSAAVSLFLFGLPNLVTWWHELGDVNWPWAAMNASAWAPWARLFSESPYFQAVMTAPRIQQAGTLATVAVIGGLTALFTSRTRSVDAGWALCIAAALLISPLGWTYYGWLLFRPLTQLQLPRWIAAAVFACWFVPPTLLVLMAKGSMMRTATIGSAYTYGLLLLWGGLLAASRRGLASTDDRLEPQAIAVHPHSIRLSLWQVIDEQAIFLRTKVFDVQHVVAQIRRVVAVKVRP
jgi:hypothetical protein